MFTAVAYLDENHTLLVLGLSRANRERLEQGQPIRVSRETHGMAIPTGLKIMIFAGDNEAQMKRDLEALIGPMTSVDQRDPL